MSRAEVNERRGLMGEVDVVVGSLRSQVRNLQSLLNYRGRAAAPRVSG